MKRIITILVACLLIAGCAAPAETPAPVPTEAPAEATTEPVPSAESAEEPVPSLYYYINAAGTAITEVPVQDGTDFAASLKEVEAQESAPKAVIISGGNQPITLDEAVVPAYPLILNGCPDVLITGNGSLSLLVAGYIDPALPSSYMLGGSKVRVQGENAGLIIDLQMMTMPYMGPDGTFRLTDGAEGALLMGDPSAAAIEDVAGSLDTFMEKMAGSAITHAEYVGGTVYNQRSAGIIPNETFTVRDCVMQLEPCDEGHNFAVQGGTLTLEDGAVFVVGNGRTLYGDSGLLKALPGSKIDIRDQKSKIHILGGFMVEAGDGAEVSCENEGHIYVDEGGTLKPSAGTVFTFDGENSHLNVSHGAEVTIPTGASWTLSDGGQIFVGCGGTLINEGVINLMSSGLSINAGAEDNSDYVGMDAQFINKGSIALLSDGSYLHFAQPDKKLGNAIIVNSGTIQAGVHLRGQGAGARFENEGDPFDAAQMSMEDGAEFVQ